MALSDLNCAEICQFLYDGNAAAFDGIYNTSGVDYAIKSYPDEIVLIFEGSHDLPDWENDFQAEMIFIEGIGRLHSGFFAGLPQVLTAGAPLLPKDKPIKVIGHSLGGGRAHQFTALLANQGYSLLETITFGSPLPGDQQLSDVLAPFPNRGYWNCHDGFFHDIVGTVPFHIPVLAPYVFPRKRILIDVPPPVNDKWGLLGWHHLDPNYIKGLKDLFSA